MDSITRQNYKDFLEILDKANIEQLKKPEFLSQLENKRTAFESNEIDESVFRKLDFVNRCLRSHEFGTALLEIQVLIDELQNLLHDD